MPKHHPSSEEEENSHSPAQEESLEATPVQTDQELVTQQPDYQAMYQRALADLENGRKRMATEKQQLLQYGLAGFITDLLPVIDNFHRATEHVPAEQANSPWVTGIQYIQKQLLDLLESYKVTPIPAQAGDRFDPHQHEAIGSVVSEEYAEDQIAEVKNQGYILHDRILRPTQVIVSQGSGSTAEKSDQ